MRIRLALLIAVLTGLLVPSRASAQACALISWGETRTASFVFSYQESASLGAEIADQFGAALDEEFNRFANLFEISLPVPVLVRVYPNEREYYCFNALAQQIPLGQTHSHIGGREIALIAQNINDDPGAWQIEGLDALRYELAVLFTNFITAEHTPPGLQAGIGLYAQDPFVIFERHLAANPLPERPEASWRNLWDSPDLVSAPENGLQAASITAYLVDVYGWERFVEFLGALRTAESWRLALDEFYTAGSNALENQWATLYYERYRDGRWRENVFYGLSLAPYEQLIAAGAYQAAADGLAEVIALLVDLEDFNRLNLAQSLNIQAQNGLMADGLARQARQAYIEGDFQAAIDFASQARGLYATLADLRNDESLAAIGARAGEVLELRSELAGIQTQLSAFSGSGLGARLQVIYKRLQELDDPEGATLAANLVAELNNHIQARAAWIAGAGAIFATALLLRQFGLARKPKPPETRLQT